MKRKQGRGRGGKLGQIPNTLLLCLVQIRVSMAQGAIWWKLGTAIFGVVHVEL